MKNSLNIVHRTGRKSAEGREPVVIMEHAYSGFFPVMGIYIPAGGGYRERVETRTLYKSGGPVENLARAVKDAEQFQCDIYGPFEDLGESFARARIDIADDYGDAAIDDHSGRAPHDMPDPSQY